MEMQGPFNHVKHSKLCPKLGRRKCIREGPDKCRVNFLNYDGVLKCFLVMAAHCVGLKECDPMQYAGCFPGLKSPTKVKAFLKTFLEIKELCAWDFVPNSALEEACIP